MKQHDDVDRRALQLAEDSLCRALLSLNTVPECRALLWDLCTPAELEAMVDRWRVVKPLKAGKPYRQISDDTGVSVTTIGRVARFLEHGNGGYQLAWERTRKDD